MNQEFYNSTTDSNLRPLGAVLQQNEKSNYQLRHEATISDLAGDSW